MSTNLRGYRRFQADLSQIRSESANGGDHLVFGSLVIGLFIFVWIRLALTRTVVILGDLRVGDDSRDSIVCTIFDLRTGWTIAPLTFMTDSGWLRCFAILTSRSLQCYWFFLSVLSWWAQVFLLHPWWYLWSSETYPGSCRLCLFLSSWDVHRGFMIPGDPRNLISW